MVAITACGQIKLSDCIYSSNYTAELKVHKNHIDQIMISFLRTPADIVVYEYKRGTEKNIRSTE